MRRRQDFTQGRRQIAKERGGTAHPAVKGALELPEGPSGVWVIGGHTTEAKHRLAPECRDYGLVKTIQWPELFVVVFWESIARDWPPCRH